MVSAMPHKLADGEYLTVSEAVEFMGCTDGWVRMLLREGKLEGRRLGQRVWLIPVSAATRARDALTTRSTGKKAQAVRPAAKRPAAKKAARRRK